MHCIKSRNKIDKPQFLSDIIEREIDVRGNVFKIKIPESEIFRIENIINQNEYSILGSKTRFKNEPIVFDIGANIGLFALYINAIYPKSSIHCFEPSPETQLLLRYNIAEISWV